MATPLPALAGTDLGRHTLVRFCPACGRLGPSPGLPALACCPDHGEAAMAPRAIAEMAQREFYRFINQPVPAADET